jgi:hypothetical protein
MSLTRPERSPSRTRPDVKGPVSNSHGSQAELSRPDYSQTLNAMSPIEKNEALRDFKKYFKEINKENPTSGLRYAHLDDQRIKSEFESFYAVLDALRYDNPGKHKKMMDEYEKTLIRANSCLGADCVVLGGKSRKSRKHKKHKQSKKRRKHKKHNKSRKH